MKNAGKPSGRTLRTRFGRLQGKNLDVDVTRTLPRSRFSFSQLDHELHAMFPDLRSVEFSLQDIVSELSLPTLRSLTVRLGDGI